MLGTELPVDASEVEALAVLIDHMPALRGQRELRRPVLSFGAVLRL